MVWGIQSNMTVGHSFCGDSKQKNSECAPGRLQQGLVRIIDVRESANVIILVVEEPLVCYHQEEGTDSRIDAPPPS